ncbi:MAG TPA: hypothetical protein DCX82_06345 [Lachnospiraceae bacterium]|nr:hypothetical protein [Lachnospiraceae bacterium]
MEEDKKKKGTKQEVTENDFADLDDLLENVPLETRSEVKKMISMSWQMGRVISPETELMNKMTSEHISTFLASQDTAMQKQFQESRENRIFIFGVFVLSLIFIVVLIILLSNKPDIMEKVLFTLGGLVTGAFGGYGYGKSKNNE